MGDEQKSPVSNDVDENRKYFTDYDTEPLTRLFYKSIVNVGQELHDHNLRPNHVTAFRAVLVALVIYIMSREWPMGSAFTIAYLGVAILIMNNYLDEMDGFMARKYNQTSVTGKYLDIAVDFAFLVGLTWVTRVKMDVSWPVAIGITTTSVLVSQITPKIIAVDGPGAPIRFVLSTFTAQAMMVFGLTVLNCRQKSH